MTAPADNNLFEQLSADLAKTQQQVEQLTLELQDAKAKLHQLVYRDGLSGVYNRRYFGEMLQKELERSKRYSSPFSLVILAIDDYARFNTTYGPDAGELVLMNIAKIIEREARPSDIIARFGAEEFAVILTETDLIGVKTFAERLCQCVAKMTTLHKGKELKAAISIGGITCEPNAGRVAEQDIPARAEQCLARARQLGPNHIEIEDLGNIPA